MSRKTVLIVASILIVVAAGIYAVQRFVVSHGLPEGLIQANGRIEGDHITIASIDEFQARLYTARMDFVPQLSATGNLPVARLGGVA